MNFARYKRIGKMRYVKKGTEIADEYSVYATNDEKAADVLLKNGLYNESAYYYIQAMEKVVKWSREREELLNANRSVRCRENSR